MTQAILGKPGSMWVPGKETGLRCLSRSLAAPPPSTSFFSCTGHSTRRFWKVSLKARSGGHHKIGTQYVQPAGNRTSREVGGRPRVRKGVESPSDSRDAQPTVLLAVVAALHLPDQYVKQSRKGWVWGCGRGSSGSGPRMLTGPL